jgi:hypothetical protein
MNTIRVTLFFISFGILQAFANPRVIGNGGDPFELRFKTIALNIDQWIQSGNANQLQLPSEITLQNYKSKMHQVLGNYSIEFTKQKVSIAGAEKTCINFVASKINKIRCNSDRFSALLNSRADDLYRLVHHEFAGLAGIEVSKGADSDYRISNQISSYLVDQVVRQLPIVPLYKGEFACTAQVDLPDGPVSVFLKPVSDSETYMLQGSVEDLIFDTYLWETRGGFQLQIRKPAPAPNNILLTFKADIVFDLNSDGSKIGSGYSVQSINATAESAGISAPVRVTCTY